MLTPEGLLKVSLIQNFTFNLDKQPSDSDQSILRPLPFTWIQAIRKVLYILGNEIAQYTYVHAILQSNPHVYRYLE